MFYDPTFLLLIPVLALAIYAQYKVQSTYAAYSRVRSLRGYTGFKAAREILDSSGLMDVKIEEIQGQLTDHYDPRKRILRLSSAVYRGDSLAALGVGCHEAGHALQHAASYTPLSIRNVIFPVASFGSMAAWPLFFIGLIVGLPILIDLGILLFAGAVFFQIVTLPVEFNASRRAIENLSSRGIIQGDEVAQTKKVLDAAALTYIAAAAMAVMQLLRLLVLRDRR
ncbi:MAG: zinc metallopeptidase [Candidatus Omnitrophica bacterium]|nr:zinc metallopeptidase [Candidatus Omnitrophota bacterium]